MSSGKNKEKKNDIERPWVVEVVLDEKVVSVVQLKREKNFIGRMTQNQVVLEHASVSRSHAMIQKTGNRFFLVDQGSQNGTRINGKECLRDEIKIGDIISIGPFMLRIAYLKEEVKK